tara:strand:+ start:527 stop:709 length:183 start_codon:yes stop_codon:yes gene_type:complete
MDRNQAVFTYQMLDAERSKLVVNQNWQGVTVVTDADEYGTISELMADLAIDHNITEKDFI